MFKVTVGKMESSMSYHERRELNVGTSSVSSEEKAVCDIHVSQYEP